VSTYRFVIAAGTFADAAVEQQHLAGQPVEVRIASLESTEQMERETADADAVIVTTNPLPRELIERFGRRLRVIGRAGIGLDAIDLEAARARGVAVVHCPDYSTEEVATHALAMILALHRRLVDADATARGDWTDWRRLKPIRPLGVLTAGVVGLGRIGSAVAARLQPLFGTTVGFDPLVEEPPAGVRLAGSLDELLAGSDVVTLHAALTDETRGLIDARRLALLRRGTILVNVARGALVDQTALVEALRGGRVAAAGIDVLAREPPTADDPILSAPNVLLSPHVAWYSEASERRARTLTVDALLDYLEGRPLRAGRLVISP
jgi:D-3-phosphoglycerate dehydrogenase